MVVASNFRKNPVSHRTGAPRRGRRKHHYVREWTRLEPPREFPLHSSELSTDKGVVVSVHLGSPLEAVGKASHLDLVMF